MRTFFLLAALCLFIILNTIVNGGVGMKTKVILITHPHTDWTVAGRYQGHLDVPLNDLGFQAVDKLVKRLAEESIQCVYSSDLKRSFQTADAVAVSKGVSHVSDARLREGRWEMQESVDGYSLLPFPVLVESRSDVQARMVEVMTQIAEDHAGQTVFVVSHWGAASMFVSYVLDNESAVKESYHGTLAALNIFEYDNGDWYCVLLNDDTFLTEQ